MSLPKMTQPLFPMTIPSTNKKVRFRPFTVKEEKLLLMVAGDSAPSPEEVGAVYKQLIENCFVDEVDVNSLTAYDLEYMFINLRSKSVSNITKVSIVDSVDGDTYDIEIDLDNAKVTAPKVMDSKLALTDKVSVILQYPTFETLFSVTKEKDPAAVTSLLIRSSIKCILEGDQVHNLKDYSEEEIDEWAQGLTFKNKMAIRDWYEAMPRVELDISYTRKDGSVAERKITGIQSFFS